VYKKATTPKEEMDRLELLLGAARAYRNKYQEKYPDTKKTRDVKQLVQEAIPEFNKVSTAYKEAEYISKVQDKKFEYLTLLAGNAWHHDDKETQVASKHKISQAELTAIKVYSAADYDYINPTYAGDDDRLQGSAKRLASKTIVTNEKGDQTGTAPPQWNGKPTEWKERVKQKGLSGEEITKIKLEAKEHGDLAIQGLKKLPDWKGPVFRGMGVSEEQINKEYKKGETIPYNSFVSTSVKQETATYWAARNATEGKVALLLIMNVTKGRDISAFSETKSEGEILLLPGSRFTVDDVKRDNLPGSHQRMYIVTLKQAN
jgi:hypothetical protein